jgi:hypothetical protein
MSLAGDYNRFLREDSRGMKKRSMVLAAVQAVANAHSVWAARRFELDFSAEAPTGDWVHG